MLTRKHEALLDDARRRGGRDVENVELCFKLLSVADAIDRDCASRLKPHRLSEGKFVILGLLRDRPRDLSPHDLAERAGVTRATITGLLDGMERDGFLRRVPDKTDRRKILIRLTPTGEALAAGIMDVHAAWIASLTETLTDEDRDRLGDLLNMIWARTDAGRAAPDETERRAANAPSS